MKNDLFTKEIVEKITAGGVGVIPTDTIYGLACSAFNESAVEKIYEIKNRDTAKPLVFLISEISNLKKFGIELNDKILNLVSDKWPGPVSIIFEGDEIPRYLHRGMGGLAIRLPDDGVLREFLSQTGPLATSSANPESEPAATDTKEAKEYFSDNKNVEFYVDAGKLEGAPSTIIKIIGGEVEVIR